MSLPATAHRLEFAPPPTPGIMRALGLALLAHAVLMAALTWGVSWRRQASPFVAEAELWSAVPQAAAPKWVEPPPAPAVAPSVAPPQPVPEPEVKAPPPDIATERDKQRALKEKKALEEKKQDDLKKQDNKRKDDQKAQAEENRQELQRQENIKRMMAGLAGASGAPASTGTALQSSGPSSSYAGRIRAQIRPNIVFRDDVNGNPTAEVEVKTAPDGTITSRKLLKSSGIAAWDEAVLKAIDKTETLPRDTDGRVPPVLVIGFRPKDN